MTEFESLYRSRCHPKERSFVSRKNRDESSKSFQCNNFEQYSRHCLFFAFRPRKSDVEATEMVSAPLEENAVPCRTCKK